MPPSAVSGVRPRTWAFRPRSPETEKGLRTAGSLTPRASVPPRRAAALELSEALRFRQRLELLERVVLDLADALARDAERLPDLLERARLRAEEPEPQLDH